MRLLADESVLPEQKTSGAAGFDLSSAEDIILPRWSCTKIKTGIAIEIPCGMVGFIRGRSSLAAVNIVAFEGTIDSDYRGEVSVLIYNHTDAQYSISVGTRIAQLVIVPHVTLPVLKVDALSETERGCGGFGSTGK